MGKYLKKAKIAGEVAAMDVSPQSSQGVRTRAKTLALQHLRTPPTSEESSYLELRSRRLEKPPTPKPKEETPCPSPGGLRAAGPALRRCGSKKAAASEVPPEKDAGVEVSLGEGAPEAEARSRNARETTPCSPIREAEAKRTTGSRAANKGVQHSLDITMPTAEEMEEFFAGPEQLQLKKFVEKYNFDPVKGVPLPGRFEWVELDPRC